MSRRSSLPGAAELFRATAPAELATAEAAAATPTAAVARTGAAPTSAPAPAPTTPVVVPDEPPAPVDTDDLLDLGTRPTRRPVRRASRPGERRPTGRERHDEKITVYVSADELFDLEHARLVLRGEHALAVDRGRIVREALAVVLADLDAKGESSILVRRLRQR